MRFPGLKALCTFGLALWLVNGNGPAAMAAEGDPVTLLALGDSLTAGYDLPQDAAFPVRLEEALRTRGLDVKVINAGVSGDTTAGGLARLDWLISGQDIDAAIVELGANDALRGLPPEDAKKNLDAILSKLKDQGVNVLLAGMMAPRNMGPDYVKAFDAMYPALAEKHDVLLYPFFLEGVAMQEDLLLPDGMHPNERGVDVMVETILPKVEALLKRATAAGG
ncbi:arylesterase [Caenispirillum salinarum]|uniref:arylesterase n=1 Tax=Caenispirillum salinarum TaxID=859058 RepID=UPI00384F4F92